MTLVERIRTQAGDCAEMGSPLYASLLEQAATDVEAGGPVAAVLAGHEDDRGASALALRLLGAVHRLVLSGLAPELAARYPSTGGDGDAEGAWSAFRSVVADQGEAIRPLLATPPQTNEVGRSAALLGGFLVVAAETGLGLRLLEIGCSAGLNLRFDRFGYRSGEQVWGDPASPVQLVEPWSEGGRPPLDVEVSVTERWGCDVAPIDPLTPEGRRALLSYVWPDQPVRLALLRGAIEVAAAVPAVVERGDAAVWLERRLADPVPGVATAVFHSVMRQYLDDEGRAAIDLLLRRAAERASVEAPVAHLAMEPDAGYASMAVRLTIWPGGEERVVALAGGHGPPVRWLGG